MDRIEAPAILVGPTFHDITQPRSLFSSILIILQVHLAALVGVLIYKVFRRSSFRLPPGPPAVPLFGNWLSFPNGINPRNLAELARMYGDVCFLRMGQRNVILVSSPEMAKEVLHTQGVEFGSRARNLVIEIATGKGQDMVFADYGEHWRNMRRIATLPFFTSKVVQQSGAAWDEEIDLAIREMGEAKGASTNGIVIRNRLQLMIYNIVYSVMFSRRFQNEQDPLYVKLLTLNGENLRLAQSFKYNYGEFIPALKPLLRGYLKDVWEATQRRLAFLKENFLDERKDKATNAKIGVDYFLEAHRRGEISENSVLYFIQDMNVAGRSSTEISP